MNNTYSQRRKEAEALIGLLAERFPKTFFVYEGRRRPLKVAIHLDILATLDGAISTDELSNALGTYCSNTGYLRGLRTGAPRIDLDGKPVGTVGDREEVYAKVRLMARNKAKTAGKPAPPASPSPKRLSLADLKAVGAARRQKEPVAV